MFNRNNRRLFILLLAGLGILGENLLAQRGGTQGEAGGTPRRRAPERRAPDSRDAGPIIRIIPILIRFRKIIPMKQERSIRQSAHFLSGKVMFDDGAPTNSDIRIERVCGATQHLEAHTDSKGRFSFQLGGNMALDTDASNSGIGSGYGQQRPGSNSPFSQGNRQGLDGLFGCEIRASYPGYRSDRVPWRTGTRWTTQS